MSDTMRQNVICNGYMLEMLDENNVKHLISTARMDILSRQTDFLHIPWVSARVYACELAPVFLKMSNDAFKWHFETWCKNNNVECPVGKRY